MVVTPAQLFELALKRHQMVWNWTLHFAVLFGFALTLLLHSYLMLAATLIVFGAGFFELNMPQPPDNRWFRMVAEAIEWEKDWLAYPWNFDKWWRFLFVLLVACISIWALWMQEPLALGLLIGFAYLIKVVRENRDGGIDP